MLKLDSNSRVLTNQLRLKLQKNQKEDFDRFHVMIMDFYVQVLYKFYNRRVLKSEEMTIHELSKLKEKLSD